VNKLEGVLDRLSQLLSDEEEKILKKKEQERANRRSAAFALQNGEAKVAVKTLPQGPSSLAALDSLLDDLEGFHSKRSSAVDSLATMDLRRPVGLQPPNYRPPEVFETNEEAFDAMQRGVPVRAVEESKGSARLLPQPRSPKADGGRPTSPFSASPQPPASPQAPASPQEKSAIDNLDELLNGLNDVVLETQAFTPTPTPVPQPVVQREVEPPRSSPLPPTVIETPAAEPEVPASQGSFRAKPTFKT